MEILSSTKLDLLSPCTIYTMLASMICPITIYKAWSDPLFLYISVYFTRQSNRDCGLCRRLITDVCPSLWTSFPLPLHWHHGTQKDRQWAGRAVGERVPKGSVTRKHFVHNLSVASRAPMPTSAVLLCIRISTLGTLESVNKIHRQ